MTHATPLLHTALWELDYSQMQSLRQGRAALRSALLTARAMAAEHPTLKHIVVFYTAPERHRPALRRFGLNAARSLSTHLERTTGHLVEVVLIDATNTPDRRDVTRRIQEWVRLPSGSVGHASVPWEQVQHEGIRRAALSTLL